MTKDPGVDSEAAVTLHSSAELGECFMSPPPAFESKEVFVTYSTQERFDGARPVEASSSATRGHG
jgi:hypothetical protein